MEGGRINTMNFEFESGCPDITIPVAIKKNDGNMAVSILGKKNNDDETSYDVKEERMVSVVDYEFVKKEYLPALFQQQDCQNEDSFIIDLGDDEVEDKPQNPGFIARYRQMRKIKRDAENALMTPLKLSR